MCCNFSWSLSWRVPVLRCTNTVLWSKPGICDEKPVKTAFSVEQQDFITTEKQCFKCKQKTAIFKVLVIIGETANFVSTKSWKVKHITDCHHCFTHIPSCHISNFSPLHFFLLLGHWFPPIHSQTPSHHAYISSKLNCAAHSSTMKIKTAGLSQTLVMST